MKNDELLVFHFGCETIAFRSVMSKERFESASFRKTWKRISAAFTGLQITEDGDSVKIEISNEISHPDWAKLAKQISENEEAERMDREWLKLMSPISDGKAETGKIYAVIPDKILRKLNRPNRKGKGR